MGAAQGLAPLLQLLPPWEMGKVRWGGRGWSCAAAPGNSLPGSGTAPMPGWKEGWKEFCPVCSANPFRSPLSCSTPLCPQHRAPGASSIPSSPRKVPGVTFRAEKKTLRVLARSRPPGRRGLSHCRERSRHIHTSARRLTPIIWAPPPGSRLGAAAISAAKRGCGEPRGIQPLLGIPGSRWRRQRP